MRIHITHETVYGYAAPAKYVIQKLRLTPRGHDGQHVRRWRIEIDEDCRLVESTDAFGNIVHTFTLTSPVDQLTITADGEIETEDTAGLVRGAVERLPLELYLRETPLTEPDDAIREFAAGFASGQSDRLALLHDMLEAIHGRMNFDIGRTDSGTTAADAFHLGHGVCQDFSHIFVAAARSIGIPARYTAGYLVKVNGEVDQDAGHAWSEAYVPDLGWVGFDPANGACVTHSYVRVAIGLDYLGAAPVRGAQSGGLDESSRYRGQGAGCRRPAMTMFRARASGYTGPPRQRIRRFP